MTKEELPACPVATTVQMIGSKWKLLIMRNLLVRPWRFNERKKDLEGISQKVLTDSLRSMEARPTGSSPVLFIPRSRRGLNMPFRNWGSLCVLS